MDNVVLDAERLINADEILKVTALLYFKEALAKQEFESCKELADSARGFGAQPDEIRAVIVSYLSGSRIGARNEAGSNKRQRS